MKFKAFALVLGVSLLFSGCLTTSAILKNKTILKTRPDSMTRAGLALGYPHADRYHGTIVKELGFQWLRIDLSWNKLEPVQGQWEFANLDAFFEEIEGTDHKILAILCYDTPWIHEDPDGLSEVSPEQLEHYLHYIEVVMKRYGHRVDEWEIWNEPNLLFNTFWTGSDEDFFLLSQKAAAKIKEIDPEATVLAGAHWRFDKSYIMDMYEQGVLDNVDVFSYHPYYDKPHKIYRKSRDLEDYLKSLGYRGDFRVTEVGFNTYGRVPTSCRPEEQGRYVLETLILLGRMKHPYLIWYNLSNGVDDDPSGLWSDQYGVVLRDGSDFEYKTGGWAVRRYNELIAGTYPSKDRVIQEKDTEKRVLTALYHNGLDDDSRVLVLLGQKKRSDLVLNGFDSGRVYSGSNGSVQDIGREWTGTLYEDEPLIFVLQGVTQLVLSEE